MTIILGCGAATIWGRLLCEPQLLTSQIRYIVLSCYIHCIIYYNILKKPVNILGDLLHAWPCPSSGVPYSKFPLVHHLWHLM